MKIVVLQGSRNIKGSTNVLVESFTRGAQESGHSVQRFDVANMKIGGCFGCCACRKNGSGVCVQEDDDNRLIREAVLAADVVVLATPLYYFNMTSQLKAVVDRFFGYNVKLISAHKKLACLAVGGSSNEWAFDALNAQLKNLTRYLEMENVGNVFGFGCGTPESTAASAYPQKAYELGKNL